MAFILQEGQNAFNTGPDVANVTYGILTQESCCCARPCHAQFVNLLHYVCFNSCHVYFHFTYSENKMDFVNITIYKY